MTTQITERRMNRSDTICKALQFQLNASADRAKFSSLVLADDLGLLVSCAGNQVIAEHLAAISPCLAVGMKPWHGRLATNRGKVRLSVAPIRIGKTVLFLSATEGVGQTISKELFLGGLGVARILAN